MRTILGEPPSDQDLLDAARAGDRKALEALLERHQAQIYRFGMRMCRDADDAKDVLQDTLLAMARGIRDFRGTSSISTWLYTIARSYCIKRRRRSKFARVGESSLDSELPAAGSDLRDPSTSPDEALASKQLDEALEQAIQALEPGYREVLLLRDVEGLTAAEVAEIVGISAQAVKSRLHRARVSIRHSLAPLLSVPETLATSPATPCPDVLTLFSQHLENEVSAEVCADMERHLDSCSRCRGTCDSLKRTLALCRAAGPRGELPARMQASVRVALRDFLAEDPKP